MNGAAANDAGASRNADAKTDAATDGADCEKRGKIKVQGTDRKTGKDGQRSTKAEMGRALLKERDTASDNAMKKKATTVVGRRNGTLAKASVCVCVKHRNSIWRGKIAEGGRQDLCQRDGRL